MKRSTYVLVFFVIACVTGGFTEDMPPVSWGFSVTLRNAADAVVHIVADVAPGWRLYSQAVGEGGLMPTRFSFAPSDCALTSPTKENGNATTYYDVVYEMEVTYYTRVVRFEQDIVLDDPTATLRGKVEYMVCNNELCVPGEEEFSIRVSP